MYTNLMSSACPRHGANHAEAVPERRRFDKAPFHSEFRQRGRTRRVNHLFEPDHRVLMFALTIQRSLDDIVLPFRPAPNDRKIFFAQLMSLHQQTEIARSRGGLCNQHESAGLAI